MAVQVKVPTVEYVGPYDEVTVPAFGLTVPRGVPVEVTEEVAAALTAQSVWRMVS